MWNLNSETIQIEKGEANERRKAGRYERETTKAASSICGEVGENYERKEGGEKVDGIQRI
ncbi:hypothetical protein [Anaerostipes caccae]|uniref:hypothetical protein n=1 Tax=Anaerostipes caccae TaxID=105841 RepID=UPI0012DFAB1B|nr:hypothetical protein [Anaerostipes caccae]MCB6295928.1 hypothetical protein [Anaerostipes caccae]MCB6353136.1 hypothetical protein [Anaerostipes caccae]MCB6363969.1 hypothetical protein [Anaerostipes caccae]MCB6763376.1 hypothetical protein [Anaerostipes caccae]MCB6796522.1 hypothetical protein [Anaerostipes caccae]